MARKKNTALKAVSNESPAKNAEKEKAIGTPAPEVDTYGEDPFGDHYVVQSVEDDYITIRYPKGETRSVDYDEWPGYAPHADVDQQDYRDAFEDNSNVDEVETPVDDLPDYNDLDESAIQQAIKSRDEHLLTEASVDIQRRENELEGEFASVKASYGKRLKLIRRRRQDVSHELEEATHEWRFDHAQGIAELVSKRTGIVKKTRPLDPAEKQVSLPFAAEG